MDSTLHRGKSSTQGRGRERRGSSKHPTAMDTCSPLSQTPHMSGALGTILTPFENVPMGQVPPCFPYTPTPPFIGQQFAYNIASNIAFASTSSPTPQPVDPYSY